MRSYAEASWWFLDLRVALAPRCQCQPWTVPEAGLITNPPGFVLCSFGAFLRFLQILASVFLFLVFSICQECGTECGPDSLQIRPDFSLCSFGAFLRIFLQIFEGVTNRIPSAISVMVKFRSFLILFMFGTFSSFLSLFVSRDFFQVLLL